MHRANLAAVLCVGALQLAVAACGTIDYDPLRETLVVQVVTDLVPGAEFDRVETSVIDGDAHTEVVTDTVESLARVGLDFAHGHQVASLRVRRGDHLVRVRLGRRDLPGPVIEQRARVVLMSSYVLRIYVTRACLGVQCPGADGGDLSSCIAGRCVDPRCTVDAPEFCGDLAFCASSLDCPPVAACATQNCDEGICIAAARDGVCARDEWCDPGPDHGCKEFPTGGETGPICGTICGTDSTLCRASYWNCEEGPAFCDPLLSLAPGTRCGDEMVCDNVGACVGCDEGASCTVGCRTGTISCALGARTCAFAVPPSYLPADAPCSDVGTCTEAMLCTPNGVCTDSGICDTSLPAAPGILIGVGLGTTTTEVGGTAMFTMRLTSEPASSVAIALASTDLTEGAVLPAMLTFSVLDWASPQSVTVTGVDDSVADGNQIYGIAFAVSSSDPDYNARVVPDFLLTNVDDETPGITVSPTTGLTTTEAGGTATFAVQLNTEPTANVVVPINTLDAEEGTALPAFLTFTNADWDIPQVVTITGVDDHVQDGDAMYLVATDPATSTDPTYNTLDADDVVVSNVDDDSAGILVSPTSGLVTDEMGASDSFAIVLASEPVADVTIPLATSNAIEGASAVASVTFTATDWDTPQVVTVQGNDDAIDDGDAMYSIVTGAAISADPLYSGRSSSDVVVTNVDDDTAAIDVTPTSGLITSESGGTATFTVVLESEPLSDVSVALSSSNLSEATVAPASVTFTALNWNTPQTVMLTGVNDHLFDPSVPYTAITAAAMSADTNYNALDPADVTAINATGLTQLGYFKASNTDINDHFYVPALSADGNTLAIGAPGEGSSATGVGGNQADNSMPNSGAVYIFRRVAGVWSQEAYIKASNPGPGDYFGAVVSLSDDGNSLAVGAWYEDSAATGIDGNGADDTAMDAGAVYVFRRVGVAWSQEAYVKASNAGASDSFGITVDMSGDGSTLAVGAQWEDSNATGIGGDQSNNSISNAGAAYVFVRSGMTWVQEAYIKAMNSDTLDNFAHSVSLSADGNTLAVGAYNEGSNAVGIGGDPFNNLAPGSGAVYVFSRSMATWTQEAYIKSGNAGGNDRFGIWVDLSADGNTLAATAYLEDSAAVGIDGDGTSNAAVDSGAAYLFTRAMATWAQEVYLKASNTGSSDNFGYHTAISADGNTLLVSAQREASNATGLFGDEANNAAANSGAVYAFQRRMGTWAQQAYVKASNSAGGDLFGDRYGVAIAGDGLTFAIGASAEASSATGLGGDQSSNAAAGSGAVYVFGDI